MPTETDNGIQRTELHKQDVIGFIIFLIVIFLFFTMSSYIRS